MAETTMATEKLYTKREAAGVLRVSEVTVHRLLKSKRLGHYRVATRVFIGEGHIQDYLSREERKPEEKAA
jgi:excisionase family DNA binding protein